MTWLWVILIVGIIGAIIGFISSGGDGEAAASGGFMAALGCGLVIFEIFLGVVSLGLIVDRCCRG